MPSMIGRAAGGAVAGVIATAVMSAQMLAGSSARAIGTAPPQRIASALLPAESPTVRSTSAVVLHLAIGAVAGALFGARRRRGVVRGVAFGLGLWALGYEVIVPVLGVLPAAHRDSRARRAALVQAHVVFGAVLGFLSR